jgi:hypothetical protein
MQRTSHQFLLRLLFVKMVFALLVTFPFEASAQYNPYPGHGTQTYRETLRHIIRNNEIFDLNSALRLPPNAQIISISVTAKAGASRSPLLQLLNNGLRSGMPQRVDNFSRTFNFPIAQSGQANLALQSLEGPLLLEEISAIVRTHNPNPGNGNISFSVNERIFNQGRIGLLQKAREQGHRPQGLRIQAVVIQGESLGRFADAEVALVINGQLTGQFQRLALRGSQVVLQIPVGSRHVGNNLQTLQLQVRGDAQINSATFRIAAGNNNPIPSPMLRLSPMRDFTGRASLNFEQAFNIPLSHSNRLVSSIVITALSRNSAEFSIVDIGRGPVQRSNVDRSLRTYRINFSFPIALRDLGFNHIGPVRVETLDIEFTR